MCRNGECSINYLSVFFNQDQTRKREEEKKRESKQVNQFKTI